jgi:hypothetical protein
MSTKTYLLLYCKKIAKETAFSHNNQPEKHHHGIFPHVSAKNGVSWQLNVNKSHDIQFPWRLWVYLKVCHRQRYPCWRQLLMVAVFHRFFGDFLCPFYRDFT